MKQFLIAVLLAMPMIASAQDNTWERTVQEPTSKEKADAKYLVENAVPIVDGKVCWETTILALGKSARQIYDILLFRIQRNSSLVPSSTNGLYSRKQHSHSTKQSSISN